MLQSKLRFWNSTLAKSQSVGARLEVKPTPQIPAARLLNAATINALLVHNARHHLIANRQVRGLKRWETDRQ